MARTRRKVEAAKDEKPAEGAGVVERIRESVSLPGLEAWSTTLRTVFINVIFLLAIIVVLPVLVSQFRRDEVIIEPIAMPEALLLQGMTPEVAASRVWDGLADVAKASDTSKDTIVALPDSRRVEFSFPDSGFSIESLVFHLRRLFGAYETRIAGEFVCADAVCDRAGARLRLRVIRDRVDLIDLPAIGQRGEREYFAEAASGVLAVLDPFVAIAAASRKEPVKATTLARRLIRSHHPDAKWAHNLIGLIRVDGGDLPGAASEFRAAVALDPEFLPARANLGNTLRVSGDLAGAEREFSELRRLDPKNVIAIEGFADLALVNGRTEEGVKLLLEAAELAPVNPRYLTKAGKTLIDLGRKDEGMDLLRRAIELDPGDPTAFALLAAMHFNAGDFPAAERIYRDAADYQPESAAAQAAHGQILATLKNWDAAIERYRRATALEPRNADHWLELARCLQRVKEHADALAALETALKLDPKNPEIHLSLGDSYRDLERKDEAVVEYRKFLELDKTDSPMRPVIERFIEILAG